jgi:hypothetical protein
MRNKIKRIKSIKNIAKVKGIFEVSFEKIFAFLKKYWVPIALTAGILIKMLFLKKPDVTLVDDIDKLQKIDKEERSKIQDALDQEQEKREKNSKELGQTLEQLQKERDGQLDRLETEKSIEVAKIIDEIGNDPNALADRLSESTGIRVEKK